MQNHQDKVLDRNNEHRVAYQGLGTNILTLRDELVENDLTQLVDFDGKATELFSHNYRMGSVEPFPVLVKKGSEDNKLTSESYNYLLGIEHRLVLPVVNFYAKGSNGNGWFILPLVEGSLEAWLKCSKGGNMMFKGTGVKKDIGPLFRDLIIDLWSLLFNMSENKLYPERIKLENFFIKMLPGGIPRIQLLLTQFRVFRNVCFTPREEWNRIWGDINLLIVRCCQVCNVELSQTSVKFCKYAFDFENQSIENVKNYPDNWSYDEKACYLYHMISDTPFEKYKIRSKINEDTALQWPKNSDGSDPQVIIFLLGLKCNRKYDEKKGRWVSKYEKEKAYDYLQLFRNHHKHFDELLSHIKELLGGSREGLIQCMETWEPNIWILLYEVIGRAGRQLDE